MASLWHIEIFSITTFVLPVIIQKNQGYMTTDTVTA